MVAKSLPVADLSAIGRRATEQYLLFRFGRVSIDYQNNLIIISARENGPKAIDIPQQLIKIGNKYILNVKALKDLKRPKNLQTTLN